MAKHKKKLKKNDPPTFEEIILQWSEEVKPGPPPTRVLTRERRPPDRYIPPPFSGTNLIVSSPMPLPPSRKRASSSLITGSSITKKSKTEVVTQVKDLMTFKPAMYGKKPKDFEEFILQEPVLRHEFEKFEGFVGGLHISRSTMQNCGLLPKQCQAFIESSKTLRRVSYKKGFPPGPEVYGEGWAVPDDCGRIMVKTVERIMEKTQHYTAQSPEDLWCSHIVQPILDLMPELHPGKIRSEITQNEVISPVDLCPEDSNMSINQSGRKKVDYVLGLQISEEKVARIWSCAIVSKSANQSRTSSLSDIPIFLDIEVKTVNNSDPLVQLRVWEAAGHKKRVWENWSTEMPMLGIVVDNYNWYLQIGFWSPKDTRLIFGAYYLLGSTHDIVSIFHIISNLHKICIWADTHYRKWLDKQIENYDNMPQAMLGKKAAAKGKEKAPGSEDGSDPNDDDEGLLSEDVGSQPSATTKRLRQRQPKSRRDGSGGRIAALGDPQDADPPNTDPIYELTLITLYEHSLVYGHKTCAYRGCPTDDTLKGDTSAFGTKGEPRALFRWLYKKKEREARKAAARVAQRVSVEAEETGADATGSEMAE